MDNFNPKVIEAVKKHPIIYTKGSKASLYSPDLLRKSWIEVQNEIGVDLNLIKDRWKNLKDTYVRYRRKEGPKMKCRWAKSMSFLEDTEKPTDDEIQETTADDKLDEIDNNVLIKDFKLSDSEVSNDYEFVYENTLEETQKIQEPNRKKTRKRKLPVEPPTDPLILDNNLTNVQCDRLDLLFLGYANSFKRLSHIKQVIVKYKMSKILMEAEMSEIKQNHI